MEALHYHRLFITENDYVGFGPEHLDKDYVIVVFFSCTVSVYFEEIATSRVDTSG